MLAVKPLDRPTIHQRENDPSPQDLNLLEAGRSKFPLIYVVAGKLDFEGLPLPVLYAAHSRQRMATFCLDQAGWDLRMAQASSIIFQETGDALLLSGTGDVHHVLEPGQLGTWQLGQGGRGRRNPFSRGESSMEAGQVHLSDVDLDVDLSSKQRGRLPADLAGHAGDGSCPRTGSPSAGAGGMHHIAIRFFAQPKSLRTKSPATIPEPMVGATPPPRWVEAPVR